MANKKKKIQEDVELDWDDHSEKPGISDGVKRILASGLSAVMTSEDGVRQYLQDLKLPKETLGNLLKGVKQSKEEIVSRVGDEFSQMIQKIDVVDEVTKFLQENKVKCSMEFEFSKKEDSSSSDNESDDT